ncbi:MAG: hypothetical protein KDB23_00380, partial [Planctomycetales bacterium]|nr:hypothetical protein [Planctomycetales bacterium]
MNIARKLLVIATWLSCLQCATAQQPNRDTWPESIRTVLQNAKPLAHPRGQRLPLYILPISGTLSQLNDAEAKSALQELDGRGIGYTVEWQPEQQEQSLQEALRIARWQLELGQPIAVNANACLHSFYDGTAATQHVDAAGQPFADDSHQGSIGCPFALEHRIEPIRERIRYFVNAYQAAGLPIDLVIADWEIDGPIEWNGAWEASRRCGRCREQLHDLNDFRSFQSQLRQIRSRLLRDAYADVIRATFPDAKVGNYGVYRHDGFRYWYDYYETPAADPLPYVAEQNARYRPWYHEFPECDFTLAMPVIYTWYPIFDCYNFEPTDYRWFYNMLKVASNAGKHAARTDTILPFVHWHTTAPPDSPDARVQQLSETKYQELLWHLLMRGHDSFFLWCTPQELAKETALVHQVYAASLEHSDLLQRGSSISYAAPAVPQSVISGVRLGRQTLVYRSNFVSDRETLATTLTLANGDVVHVASTNGLQILEARPPAIAAGFLQRNGKALFPLGTYELSQDDAELKRRVAAGVNLFRCESREDLDRVQRAGAMGWIPIPLQGGPSDEFAARIASLADHPALAVWEGPDEIIWTFTAYSGLKQTAGYTRADWETQQPIAVKYARE